jgi:hypothetical protein
MIAFRLSVSSPIPDPKELLFIFQFFKFDSAAEKPVKFSKKVKPKEQERIF